MLISALFLVLFSNHMEERLRDKKAVLRVDCHMTAASASHDKIQVDEKKVLITQRQASIIIYTGKNYVVFFPCTGVPVSRSGVHVSRAVSRAV